MFQTLSHGQVEELDSIINQEINTRIRFNGRNPVYNYQLYFNYDDKYIFDDGVGIAKKKDSTSVKHLKFKSASVSKTFIAVMILQLEEEGIVDIEDNVVKYLDSTLIRDLKIINGVDKSKDITIVTLLNHTAGLKDYILEDKRFLFQTNLFPGKLNLPIDHLNRYKKHSLNKNNTPVGEFHYSDTHYLILALLIEKVTGESLQDNLKKRIALPVNLKATYVDSWDSTYTNFMHQYKNKKDLTEILHPSIEFGGGGFITTTNDLAIFMRHLFLNKLFTDTVTLSKMLNMNDIDNYGLGIMRKKIPENWIKKDATDTLYAYGHDGYFGIEMYYIPKKNITWISSKGQCNYNKHVNNIPIWLTLLRICDADFKNKNSR